MPGATETDFFERAGMLDTKVGQAKKDDPKDVAETGFKAMMRGDGDIVSGWQNKLQSANCQRDACQRPRRGASASGGTRKRRAAAGKYLPKHDESGLPTGPLIPEKAL